MTVCSHLGLSCVGVLSSAIRSWSFRHLPHLALRLWIASRAELGLAGEQLAARALQREGWRLRGRRVRTSAGEVDIWATTSRASLVVEVKTARLSWTPPDPPRGLAPRWDLRWRPGLSLSDSQKRRLFRAARLLAGRRNLRPEVRLIEVLVARDGQRIEVLPATRVLEPGAPAYTLALP